MHKKVEGNKITFYEKTYVSALWEGKKKEFLFVKEPTAIQVKKQYKHEKNQTTIQEFSSCSIQQYKRFFHRTAHD